VQPLPPRILSGLFPFLQSRSCTSCVLDGLLGTCVLDGLLGSGQATPKLSEGEVQLLDALALGGLAAAVVAGGGDDGGVAGELLRGREVHAGVEQVGNEAAP